MARIVDAGLLSLDAVSNGLINRQTLHEIKALNQNFASSLGSGVSNWFKDKAQNAFELFGGDRVMARLEGLMRKNEMFWEGNTIRPLTTLGELQQAPEVMYEWLAIHPELNEMINDQRCHGWGGDYARYDGIGDDNHLYRVLYHGVSKEFPDAGENEFKEGWVMYFDEPDDNEHLSLSEHLSVLRSHDTISDLLHQDRDFTDPLNNRF